jgi:hypothetical protein
MRCAGCDPQRADGEGPTIMASEKKRRKMSSIDRRLRRPAPAKPKDGDRRHRCGVDLARLEQQRKEAAREWNLDVGWTDAPAEPG